MQVAPPSGLTSSVLSFSSPRSHLDIFEDSGGPLLLLPSLACTPSPPPHSPCPPFSTLGLCCQVSETLMFCVLGNGISWSLLILVGPFVPSPTHMLSLYPALACSLEREQKRPCSLHCPLPFPPPPLFPPTLHFCPLSWALEESPLSLQPVWWDRGFPLILHCFLHPPRLQPSSPPAAAATIATSLVTD